MNLWREKWLQENCECGLNENGVWKDAIFEKYGCHCDDTRSDEILQSLKDAVMVEMGEQIADGDWRVIDNLLDFVPTKALEAFLPEGALKC